MASLKISEQQIINALCLYIAQKRQVQPQEVVVELMYDDDYGYSAEVEVNNRQQILIQANMIEALRLWLDTQQNIDPFSARLRFELHEEEGIIAFATVGE